MKNKQIYQYFGEATNYGDPDAFASDVALSLLDPEDPSKEIDTGLYEQLRILWQVANAPFKELLENMGLNQTQCSIRFCIPRRTIQDWTGDRRTPPAYLRLMMAESIGLLQIRDDAPPTR